MIEISATAFGHASCSATVTVIRGAPWYKRSPRILWEDATYPFREKFHSLRAKRNQAKARKQIQRSQPLDTSRDAIYFSNDEWKSEPAIALVRRLLDELDVIFLQAEQEFLSVGSSGS